MLVLSYKNVFSTHCEVESHGLKQLNGVIHPKDNNSKDFSKFTEKQLKMQSHNYMIAELAIYGHSRNYSLMNACFTI